MTLRKQGKKAQSKKYSGLFLMGKAENLYLRSIVIFDSMLFSPFIFSLQASCVFFFFHFWEFAFVEFSTIKKATLLFL